MKHHIIVKFTEDVSKDSKPALRNEILELFSHTTEIEGIHSVSVIPNCIDRANRYDLMIVIDMDESSLPLYDECIWHKKWKSEYSSIVQSKAIFDCE